MTDRDDGGPAFPTEPNTQPGFYQHHGMTLRDWFAGQALAGMERWVPAKADGSYAVDTADVQLLKAKWAYQQADAMLRARKGEP